MKHLISIVVILLLSYPVFSAVDTTEIAAVRNRAAGGAQISAADQAAMTKFWQMSLDRMFQAPEPQEVVDVRLELSRQKGTEGPYAAAYMAEGVKDIQIAFETAEKLENTDKKALVNRNLMILAAELQNVQLVPVALQRIGDPDEVVRYWAVKTVTQQAIVTELANPNAAETKEAILKALLELANAEQVPQIMKMIIIFAGSVDHPTARQLLTAVADKRIEAYKNWTVNNEEVEIPLLNALGGVAVLQQGETKSSFGRKFGELYALVLQRYMKGQAVLSNNNIERLVTVITEVDQMCLSKMMEIKTGIQTAIMRKTGLDREYEGLFGNRMMAGTLGTKLRFDYGKDASGKAITSPPELGPVPAGETVAIK